MAHRYRCLGSGISGRTIHGLAYVGIAWILLSDQSEQFVRLSANRNARLAPGWGRAGTDLLGVSGRMVEEASRGQTDCCRCDGVVLALHGIAVVVRFCLVGTGTLRNLFPQ